MTPSGPGKILTQGLTVLEIMFLLCTYNKSHRRAGAMPDFLLTLEANKEMFEQNLNVSFL
jgi:hypothetical protein